MTTTTTSLLKDIDASWIQNYSKEQNEPDWVLNLRLDAFKKSAALDWPDKKNERWKRTELKALKWDKLSFSPTHQDQDKSALKDKSFLIDPSLTNGKTPGIEWLSLDDAIKSKADDIKKAWAFAIQKAEGNKFKLLSLALASGGLCLVVPKNRDIKAPLHQTFAAGEVGQGQFPLNFIIIEQGSQVQFWEELLSSDSKEEAVPTFVSSATVIHLKDNAKASFVNLQHFNENTVHFQFQDVIQEAHTSLNTISIAVGGRISHGETTIHLNGSGSENKVLGVLFGDRKQNFENWVTQNHGAQQTNSDIQYRGVLQGKAKSFFSGMVSIVEEAQRSDAFQSFKGLLLSKDARADAIPNLEILADDVKCAHGAAMGPVDEDQKYYLQTRGVPPDVAEKIIIQGFFEPVVAAVPSETVQERLRSFIEEKINTHE